MDMSGAALGNLTATQRDQLMSEVKQQLAVANAQELLTVNKNGFLTHCTVRRINAFAHFIHRKSQRNASKNALTSRAPVSVMQSR